MVRDQLMADALVVADVVEALDAELLDESTCDLVRSGALFVGDGSPVSGTTLRSTGDQL
jgi:hypothetical protein